MTENLQENIIDKSKECPFCGNNLDSKFSKCYNVYCHGQKFTRNNWVIYRLNPELGIGKIIKEIKIPASKSLEEEDTYFIEKFKVQFQDGVIKIIHPVDLVHYIFDTNKKIKTDEGIGVINSADFSMKGGEISYEVLFSDGKKSQMYENEIISPIFESSKDQIFQKKLVAPKKFLIKYWASLFYSYYTSHQIKCITNSRLSLMPHQINVAHRLSEKSFPRMILADEVGLGKTIEAGIYIKEMMARNLAERILIITPATLINQWKFEFSNKFNIDFKIYDGRKIKQLTKKGSHKSPNFLKNPFYYDNLIMCSLQFARNPKYIRQLSQISWDIVIFDEAHHLRRYLLNKSTGNYRETLNYKLAKNLANTTESLLLLTATPLQLHSFELFSLIELIHPEAFENFSDFEHFRKNMPFINLLIKNVSQIEKLNKFEVKTTIKLLKDLEYVPRNKSLNAILDLIKTDHKKKKIIKDLEKEHTLSKFLIRNRKKNVISKDYINERIVKTILVKPRQEELDIYNEIRLYLAKIYNMSGDFKHRNIGLGFVITTLQKLLTSSKHAFLKSLERRLKQIQGTTNSLDYLETLKSEDPEYFESQLEEENIENGTIEYDKLSDKSIIDSENQEKVLIEFYQKLSNISYDSKSEKLLELLQKVYENNPNEKIIIFTQFVDTMSFLKRRIIKENSGFFVETFYGGKNKQEKAEAVERFRESSAFSVLLSTEVGGEGRNFQFCRTLINYDLPWNPMKLEQRIGRLDRIGQKSEKIFIYNFFLEGTIETDIIYALNKRINLFQESIGKLEPIIGKIEKNFKELIFTEDDNKQKKLRQFNRNLDAQIKKANEMEMQLDDLLIDKKSFQMDTLIKYNSCQDVKLSHNELFYLIQSFFLLDNGKYGRFVPFNNSVHRSTLSPENMIDIVPSEKFLKYSNNLIQREYEGTFDLELAKINEEHDFFALGHPLINDILKYAKSDNFGGNFTVLSLKRKSLPKEFQEKLKNIENLYLGILRTKFQGFLIEENLVPVILDENGNQIHQLEDLILEIKNFEKFFHFSSDEKRDLDVNKFNLKVLTERVEQLAKTMNKEWRKEIFHLNSNIYRFEREKKRKIYNYKKEILKRKVETLRDKLIRKKSQRPSERQIKNINQLDDEKKKQERLKKIEQIEEDITFLRKDIDLTRRKLDDLEFFYEDQKKDMKKRNAHTYFTELIGFALIRVID
jgi:SNF2 family DNA or RNA helicase